MSPFEGKRNHKRPHLGQLGSSPGQDTADFGAIKDAHYEDSKEGNTIVLEV